MAGVVTGVTVAMVTIDHRTAIVSTIIIMVIVVLEIEVRKDIIDRVIATTPMDTGTRNGHRMAFDQVDKNEKYTRHEENK